MPGEQLPIHTIAWVAGVVDAFGIIRVRRYGEHDLAAVFLHGPNMVLLERVAQLTGTKVTTVRRSYAKYACTEHCSDKHVHVSSVSGRWSLTGRSARILLEAVLPYLHVQRASALEILELTQSAPVRPGSDKRMIALGWPVS